jgi:hypothetical protein
MLGIDTNVVIRLIISDDAEQTRRARKLVWKFRLRIISRVRNPVRRDNKLSLQLNSGNGALWKSTRWESFLPRASCLRLTSVYLININALRNIRNLI